MLNLAIAIRILTCTILIAGLLTIPAAAQNGLRPLPPGGFYVSDVSNPDHNPVIVAAQSHLIYVNNPPSDFGDPATFLTDLGNSEYIHLMDQYLGSSGNQRYTLGQSFNANHPIPADHFLTMDDVFNIVHDAARTAGSGTATSITFSSPKTSTSASTPLGFSAMCPTISQPGTLVGFTAR